MKKALAFVLSVFMITALFCGCGGSGDKTLTVELEANATTGYQWAFKTSKDGIVELKGEYVQNDNPEGFVGVGGTQKYAVTGLAEGEVTITFEYLSPGDKTVGQTAIYVFTVDKDLTVTEKSHSGDYFDKK